MPTPISGAITGKTWEVLAIEAKEARKALQAAGEQEGAEMKARHELGRAQLKRKFDDDRSALGRQIKSTDVDLMMYVLT